ncbi:amidase [Rhodalgimonas zhirmunskyi]|uniref:Amidase n=1 Tax=Rhodalgimonas zhirmunskyi TaxID=2964767 RepID=A0AAJ1X3Y3_9RHOB|nr:amidase [Rhodoalgimonas zhirmunskyi]MDQ2092554.1 amidase [Rhodoalgimonas zhirmunskyi]
MSDILDKDALDQAAALERGEISTEELMIETLARIDAVNGEVNAIVSLRDRDAILEEARAADKAPRKGWMHGLPLAVKDLANVAGLPTSMGSPIFAGQIAEKDDIVVARMREAGAIIIGKTNTPEFGLGSHTFNPVHGATHNPYDLGRSAGGSSGGAAAALACRMLPVADGSDMMGSLRNPAAWNNVYGFRPSWGRVPSEPHGDSFLHQLATNGPMARSPRDVAALLDVQSGRDPRQPHCYDADPCLPEIGQETKGLRLGWLGDWGGAFPMEEGILELCETALAQFPEIGMTVDPVAPAFEAAKIWDSWTTLRSWAVAGASGALYEQEKTRDMLKPEAIWEIERGLSYSAMEVHRASLIRSQWFRRAAELFESYDALILPTAQVWPFPVDWRAPQEVAGQKMDTYHRWMEVVVPVGLLGLPCLAIPAGFGASGPAKGLPMGLQVFGPRGSDARLLALGQAWHEKTRFTDIKPELLGNT